ncbi:protein decapping 5-like isoform X2 [Nicotiana sylvestris]|uniref:Protein decapping 5-like isoform X1 n=1 Tax=Nicotiana sylvestris TaxID=4096 RepID=A0A1U7W0R9_NICSY|nr:PREDICTED: protein decapping 5-like isoform X1 [Nicotiana sylvestris]
MANNFGINQPSSSTTAAAASPSPSSSAADSYIGSFISLTSKSEIRYEGVLYYLNPQDSSLGLKNVRSYGTEGRKRDGPQVPPNDRVYDYILFRGSDIKDLQVKSSPPPQVEESLDNDPAIIQSRCAGVHPSSSRPVSLNGGSLTEYGTYKEPASLNSVPPSHQSVNHFEQGSSEATQSNFGSYTTPTYGQRHSEPASSHHAPQHSLLPAVSHPMMQDLLQAYPLQGPEPFTSTVLSKSVAPVPLVTTANSLSLTSRHSLAPQQLPMAPSTNIISPLLNVSSLSSYAYAPSAFAQSGQNVGSYAYAPLVFPQSGQSVGNSGAPILARIGSNTSPLYPVSPVVDSSSGVFPQQPPRLLTPDQLSLPRLSGQLYSDQKDLGALSSEPLNPSSLATPAVQAPLLPLPPAAKKLQSSSEFTEEFDFVAMNEKFNKDEVWGYLGKAKQTAKTMDSEDIGNENKGNEDGHGLDCNADPKPAYNKDDFFDNISRNTVARGGRNGQNRFSQRMRQDTETFGNHQQRPYPGYGGYGPGHGGHRGGYGWGRGYNNYGSRGRGGYMRM